MNQLYERMAIYLKKIKLIKKPAIKSELYDIFFYSFVMLWLFGDHAFTFHSESLNYCGVEFQTSE